MGANRVPFLAFTTDSESAGLLRQFIASHGWEGNLVYEGDINTAADFLKLHPSPQVLCVDIISAEATPASLDRLADVCDPGIKVIVSGKVNEYSFYCWLVEAGITNYLLKPFSLHALEAAYRKAIELPSAEISHTPEIKKDAETIAVIGSRGGVGATTVSVNLAWILANHFHQKTALVDFDPQLGTVALAVDLEPSKGLRDALEKPDRIDGLFIDRVMTKAGEYLSVLSTEEPLDDYVNASEASAEALLKQIKPKFSHLIIDLPRVLSPFTRYALKYANHIICVSEYTIMGLRESLRYLDFCRDILKVHSPIFIANQVGLAGKHEIPKEEFEKGLGQKVAFDIPFTLDAHASANSGEIWADTAKNAPATKVLQAIAGHFVDGIEVREQPSKLKGLLSLLRGEK